MTDEGFLNYVRKQLRDFRECGIDPVSGLADSQHDAAEGYICIENKGWYEDAGPICTQHWLFDKPACVEWRKERGLEHMPKPEWK
ncbi:hypothetical protein AAV94_12655 [Lampropedia cohaerens]|uniref:Uncharacterized protein n=2 Tax=Lampropedia cohaerens TaxID=1610491 RepID=A0A0U1PX53_9BURK|nr:hypothetical protein AAV94_12655 [Lampropedia cohaerens]